MVTKREWKAYTVLGREGVAHDTRPSIVALLFSWILEILVSQ